MMYSAPNEKRVRFKTFPASMLGLIEIRSPIRMILETPISKKSIDGPVPALRGRFPAAEPIGGNENCANSTLGKSDPGFLQFNFLKSPLKFGRSVEEPSRFRSAPVPMLNGAELP